MADRGIDEFGSVSVTSESSDGLRGDIESLDPLSDVSIA